MGRRPAGLIALLFAAAAAAGEAPPSGAIQLAPSQLKWVAGGPNLPAGSQVAVLEGDPKQAGLFTMRLKVPAGGRIAPHWHPRDERVTVIAGTAVVGFGDVLDETGGRRFGPGAYYVNPARSHHYVWFPEATILQATGIGPWELHPVEPQ